MLTTDSIEVARRLLRELEALRCGETELFHNGVVSSDIGRAIIAHLTEITKYTKGSYTPQSVDELVDFAERFLEIFT